MSNEALAGAIFDAALSNSAVASLAMPLEQGIFSQIFGDATTGLVPLADRPSDARTYMQETAEPLSGDEVIRSDPMRFRSSSTELVFFKHAVPVLAKKVRLSDDDIFELHVQRFELILAHSCKASILGRSFREAPLEARPSKACLVGRF